MAAMLLLLVGFGDAFGQAGASEPADYAALLAEAVRASHATSWRDWAFTETEVTSEGVYVGRFDPRRSDDERWVLLSVNGREPTEDEIEEYAGDKEGELGWMDSDDDSEDIIELVDPERLQLVEETDEHLLFRFVPDEEDLEEGFVEHLDATLRIAREGPWLEYIDLHSTEAFRPRFGVRVRDFVTRLVFQRLTPEGAVVPRLLEVKISLRALLVISIDEHVLKRYSDYERVAWPDADPD